MAELTHPQLKTTFRGLVHRHSTPQQPIHQFRGIKYANLAERFNLASLNEVYPPRADATKHGPACPQLPFPLKAEDVCIGLDETQMSSVAVEEAATVDEFECLNLVITVPHGHSAAARPLPVLAWVHGGGCEWGSSTPWFTDGGALVARSAAVGKPIVFVAFNYRLSVLGWSTSSSLGAGDTGSATRGVGNYGLHDAHLALEWIHRFIGPFGGDNTNIAVGGESGGAAIVRNLLGSKLTARYSRAIIQSATPFTYRPRSLAEKSAFLEDVANRVGMDHASQLRNKDKAHLEILGAYWTMPGPFNGSPTADKATLDDGWEDSLNFADGASRELLVGDMANEGTLWLLLAQNGWTEADPSDSRQFLQSLEQRLDNKLAESLSGLYDLSTTLSLAQLAEKAIAILGDAGFTSPTNRFSLDAQKHAKVYRYTFNKRNPFPGQMHGLAGHALDLAYLFSTAETFKALPNAEQETSLLHAFQDRWIGFVNGIQPWQAISKGKYASINDECTIEERALNTLRGQRRLDACELFETLSWEQTFALQQVCLAVLRSHVQAMREPNS